MLEKNRYISVQIGTVFRECTDIGTNTDNRYAVGRLLLPQMLHNCAFSPKCTVLMWILRRVALLKFLPQMLHN